MTVLHWAETLSDSERTLCGQMVGWLLAETEDNVTYTSQIKFYHDLDACEDCKREIE